MEDYAVYVKDATKGYGKTKVLQKLTMKVERGTIYGLLGASGCGKTTLLSCIVGRKKLESGEVWVMGGKPGTEGSGVPGPRVGYMPQDIALVGEFTVKDAVYYFGRILNMEDSQIFNRFQKLKKLLDLPPDERYLKDCSGGQQRRVSFAAAMIHSPELLILDEPTVGLDPVLRDSIWNYLVDITEKEQTAVIITTHYIEEAKQAHRIGLMREGKLLAEETPEKLLTLFGKDTLEDVFLILSKRQQDGKLSEVDQILYEDNTSSVISRSTTSMSMSLGPDARSTDMLTKTHNKKYATTIGAFGLNRKRMNALLSKNFKQFFRNTGGIAFTFLFPLIEMLAFLLAVGGNVADIRLGIINDESLKMHCSNYSKEGTTVPYNFTNCEFHDLGCRFIHDIEDPMFYTVYYDDYNTAIEDIKHGKIIGVMHMADNFSESSSVRLNDNRKISNETLSNSEIKVWLDMSNRQIGAAVQGRLYKKYQDFQVNAFKDCKLLGKLAEVPIRFNFEYGGDHETYTIFMVPGVLLTVMFFLGTTLTSTIIITDRLEGVWDRSIVAGVTSLEIVLTHFLTQFILVFLQTVEVIILTFNVFGIDYIGNLFLIFLHVVLQGLTGMVFGFYISIVSDSHSAANILSSGAFYPMILLCGMVWPLEAQPWILRLVSKCLPFTVPIISLRGVIKKGYTFKNNEVLVGFGIAGIWVIGLSIISIFAIKAKR